MRLTLPLLALACTHPTPPAAPSPEQELTADVQALASDAMAGRGTLEPGGARAADFLVQRLSALGLQPAPGQADLRVPYTLYATATDDERTWIDLPTGDRLLASTRALRAFDFSAEGERSAPLVFAGYGITAPDLGWDDYQGLDVTGKIVLVLRHTPNEADEQGPFAAEGAAEHGTFAAKARNAVEHGAVAMLLVTDPLHHEGPEDLRPGLGLRLDPPEPAATPAEPAPESTALLAVHVARTTVAALFAGTSVALIDLQRAVDQGHSPASLAITLPQVGVSVGRAAQALPTTDHNVVGVLPGTDPTSWVLIGAHYDHLGAFAGDGDTVYNGADDNASGTAAALALARAFATSPEPRTRGVAFAFFSGEEHGLLGSKAFVRDNVLPSTQIAFMLNLDMVGRSDNGTIEVVGDGYATGLLAAVTRANSQVGLPLKPGGLAYAGNSDHDSFFQADVPMMFFFSGLHDDYHQLTDSADKLDFPQLHRIVRLGYHLVSDVASGSFTPQFRYRVAWLGLIAELVDGKATVTEIDPDSRATAAGIAVGDVFTAFDDEALLDPSQLGPRFRGIEPGTSVTLHLRRGEADVQATVLRARTGYLGVYPEAATEEMRAAAGLGEDEGVLLRSVVEEGPAARAGLRAGDVIYSLGGYRVGIGTLSDRLARIGAGEEIAVEVWREGERVELVLVLGERPG
jgi:hypothetical protein